MLKNILNQGGEKLNKINGDIEQKVAKEILKVKGSIESVINLLDIITGVNAKEDYINIGPFKDKENLIKIIKILFDFQDQLDGDFRITRKKGEGFFVSIALIKKSIYPIEDMKMIIILLQEL